MSDVQREGLRGFFRTPPLLPEQHLSLECSTDVFGSPSRSSRALTEEFCHRPPRYGGASNGGANTTPQRDSPNCTCTPHLASGKVHILNLVLSTEKAKVLQDWQFYSIMYSHKNH